MSKLLPSRMVPWLAAMVPIGLSACNQYEMFLVTGDEQVSFSGKVDVLFVIDNSSSVTEEASALLKNFDTFIDNLAGDSAYGQQTESLTDAVNTTPPSPPTVLKPSTTTWPWSRPTSSIPWNTGVDDPGEAGRFVGEKPVVRNADQDAAHRLQQHIGCWSSCWQSVETQATYIGSAGDCEYPDTESGKVSSQYLDCLCGDVTYPQDGGDWNDSEICHSASGESPIEASLLAMCRAVEDPPEIRWHDRSALSVDEGNSPRTADWYMTNDGRLREGSKVVVIVVTDADHRTQETLIRDPRWSVRERQQRRPTPYLRAFDQFDKDITFAFIGPTCVPLQGSSARRSACRVAQRARRGSHDQPGEGDRWLLPVHHRGCLEIEDPEATSPTLRAPREARRADDQPPDGLQPPGCAGRRVHPYVDGAEISKAEKAARCRRRRGDLR